MNGRELHSGWVVAAALLGALLLGMERHPASPRPSAMAGWAPVADTSPAFRHEDHEGLFPLCTGCHLGAGTGDDARLHPEAADCASCHDGATLPRVSWTPPGPRASNLDFAHGAHGVAVAEAGQPAAGCADCHAPPPDGMAGRPSGEPVIAARTCFACHAGDGARVNHRVDANCSSCHVPAAESTLDEVRLAALRAPADHDGDPFLAYGHGPLAIADDTGRCATCHVQDQCASCHVNAAWVAPIVALPVAPGARVFPALTARYPVPATHGVARFALEHGDQVTADASECATCHTSDSCRSCHLDPVPFAVDALPSAGDTITGRRAVAPGTVLHRSAPESHRSAFFAERHGALAATRESSCTTCHSEERFCTTCHEGLESGGAVYHVPGYVLGHAAEAANATTECATCHDPVAFCRSCHDQQGLQSRGRLGPGYHDAEPLWLLRHPQAARQQLESCTTCHTQRDCLQCHSQLGAFQISPHGPDFDARAAYERNPVICRACHIGDPFGGGLP